MKQKTRIGINGFGRIGRTLFRLLHKHPVIEVVAINDIADTKTLSHLLKYDSIHGIAGFDCDSTTTDLLIDGVKIPLSNYDRLEDLSWPDVDIVVECTGKFKTRLQLEIHLQRGADKVLLSVPPQDDTIKTVVLGVNEYILDGTETIISNASCTTNNAAPMIKLVHELCEVEQAYITTVHSYTSDQNLHDKPHRDLRRSRAATQSIIPTTTGAAKALTKIFPDLSDVIGGCGIRVPVPNGSLTDMTLNVKRPISIKELNKCFREAAQHKMKGILQYTEDPIVSIDIVGNTHSCVFDAQMTSVVGKMVKLIGWYDNEVGYASRLMDLISLISKK